MHLPQQRFIEGAPRDFGFGHAEREDGLQLVGAGTFRRFATNSWVERPSAAGEGVLNPAAAHARAAASSCMFAMTMEQSSTGVGQSQVGHDDDGGIGSGEHGRALFAAFGQVVQHGSVVHDDEFPRPAASVPTPSAVRLQDAVE